jgi:signal peptidase II
MRFTVTRARALPFFLSLFIVIADQAVKFLVVKYLPLEGPLAHEKFVQFWHIRNKAIAFSLGSSLPEAVRPALFIILPLLVLGLLLWYYFGSEDFTVPQRWAVGGIIGGGIGNILDRLFRPDGVVDFISIKFYGFLGLERWPTFNIADASVVLSCLVFLVSIFMVPRAGDGPPQREEKAAS